ncbi:MAG: cobyrinate a,c-diamide synthase [Alphaproteobacteria bacterium]|nr:cobyrinate a,c-diamide synthase [Alphaproteobacteria bacterium]
MSAAGLILAAPSSGAGKTVVTLALMRALSRRGLRIAPAKVGPDYIDPAFHAAACGRASVNLDPWGMRPALRAALVERLGADADLVLVEGVMGLFDGAGDGGGSTADLAAETGWPVVLILDVNAQAGSAAAVARGFVTHRADVEVAGVILNRVGGAAHQAMIEEALAAATPDAAPLGAVPHDGRLALPERHLGLIQAREHGDLDAFVETAAEILAESVDLDRLVALARPARRATERDDGPPIAPLGQRIAVGQDQAFAFVYPHLLDGWRRAGAAILPFSPLADAAPAAEADAVYLPGGYPELHAGRLAANRRFLDGLRAAAARGAAVFGECGGYMTLGDGLVDADGARHAMAGLLPVETSFAERRMHLGYRRAETLADSALGPAGLQVSGHEFHFATTLREGPGTPLFRLSDTRGEDRGAAGLVEGRVAGSFLHVIDRAPW